MQSRYHYVCLKTPKQIEQGTHFVGYVLDIQTKNRVLIVKVCDSLIKKTKQPFYLDSVERNPNNFYDFCGEVSIDTGVYFKECINDKSYLITLLMHELGHCFDKSTLMYDQSYPKIRLEYLRRGKVHPCELFADEFSVKERGLDKFLEAIDKMFFYRMQRQETVESKRWALLEFELRKKHAIRFANDYCK